MNPKNSGEIKEIKSTMADYISGSLELLSGDPVLVTRPSMM
ncbi:MAG: hypothetical protein R2758_12470 [Bacteroidales bacterium]